MAIYPPNTTTPKKGLNYVWSWLGSSLKNFAAALQPYLGGGEGYKKYVALFDSSFNQTVLENTLGQDLNLVQDGIGQYRFISPVSIFDVSKTVCSITINPGVGAFLYGQIGTLAGDDMMIYLNTYDSTGALANYNSPWPYISVEIRVYP